MNSTNTIIISKETKSNIDKIFVNKSNYTLTQVIKALKNICKMRDKAFAVNKVTTIKNIPLICYHNRLANLNSLYNNGIITKPIYNNIIRILDLLGSYNNIILLEIAEHLKELKSKVNIK